MLISSIKEEAQEEFYCPSNTKGHLWEEDGAEIKVTGEAIKAVGEVTKVDGEIKEAGEVIKEIGEGIKVAGVETKETGEVIKGAGEAIREAGVETKVVGAIKEVTKAGVEIKDGVEETNGDFYYWKPILLTKVFSFIGWVTA